MSITKEKAKRQALVSEVLERLQKATSKQIIAETGLDRIRVHQYLAALLEGHYVAKGELTGKGNENYWIHIKPYEMPSFEDMEWDLHYKAFHNLVSLRNAL